MNGSFSYTLAFTILISLPLFHLFHAQQTYLNNNQLACYNNVSYTLGFECDLTQPNCTSYLIFKAQPTYDSAIAIGTLLGADPSKIAEINGVTHYEKIPTDTQIIVPVNCSCSGEFYQHNSSYTIESSDETYFIISNDTYQGLTTCQAMMNQNEYDSRSLLVGMELLVPLRCACPSRNQSVSGVRFLLTYMIAWRDSTSEIAKRFSVDQQSILDANRLSLDDSIFPFTPLLIPLKREPERDEVAVSPPPSQSPAPVNESVKGKKSKSKWVFAGIGIGVGCVLLALLGFLVCFLCRRPRHDKPVKDSKKFEKPVVYGELLDKSSESTYFSAVGARDVIGSLMIYKFEELEIATGFFGEDNRIEGSIYRGVINGDYAAIKIMKGDVSSEINILKQINHSNIVRLSGFCLHEGNTYLIYEFAENGSLNDWLHEKKFKNSSCLNWKQRVQIAYDVADGLNYLHNYANPPYIHKNLKGSNILLDGNFRAKLTNFGLARELNENQEEGMQLTRHVVGTQGYMAPEYLENGLITPKFDVFSFGVVILELLSGRKAVTADEEKGGKLLLSESIKFVVEGKNVREKLRKFVDPSLQHEYPLDLVYTMAQLAMQCVDHDLSSRPTASKVFASLSKILSSSLDWDPSDGAKSKSMDHGR